MKKRVQVPSKKIQLLAIGTVLSLLNNVGLAQKSDCDACDGVPMNRCNTTHQSGCAGCGHRSPTLAERFLSRLDRLGDAVEHSVGRLPKVKCTVCLDQARSSSCDAKGSCGCEASCGAEPSCGTEPSCGCATSHSSAATGPWSGYASNTSAANQGVPNGARTTPSTSGLSKETIFKSTRPVSKPIPTANGSSPTSIPVPSPSAPIPVPSSPATPEDWQHDPFQDDTRRSPALNRYRSEMPRMENASNVNHAFDPQAYIRKQQSIELANHIAPERSSNGKVVRRSLIDSQPANQDGVVAPASFDVTARVPNRVRRSLADSTLGTSEEASVEEDTSAVELPTEGAGRDKLTLEKASQPRQSEEGSGALKPLTFSLKKLKPLLDVPRLK